MHTPFRETFCQACDVVRVDDKYFINTIMEACSVDRTLIPKLLNECLSNNIKLGE